jgi:hypothetical protein
MLSAPQGLTEEQFADLSAKVRAATAHLGTDVQVQGSRVTGTARPASDLDLAIRVSPERFEQILVERFGAPRPGSAKDRTMQHARKTGKIQAGEAGLRPLRKALEADLGIEVDLSVIRQGGPFDQGPYLPLKGH